MFSWSEPEKLSIAQQTIQNAEEYKEKRKNYLQELTKYFADKIVAELLYQSTLGEREVTFGLDSKEAEDCPKLVLGTEERPHTYEITNFDRRYLLTELVQHFSDKSKYPLLKCEQNVRGWGSPQYIFHLWVEEEPLIEA